MKEEICFSLRIEQAYVVTVIVSAVISAAVGTLDSTIKKVQGMI